MRKTSAVIGYICALSFFCTSCSVSSQTPSNRQNNKQSSMPNQNVVQTIAPVKDDTTKKKGEPVICEFGDSTIEYIVTNINIYQDISKLGFAVNDFIDYRAEQCINEDGSLNSQYEFILLDVSAKALSSPNETSPYGENTHNISSLRLYDDEKDIGECMVDLFSIEQADGIERSSNPSHYYNYTLPVNQTANIQIGFFISRDDIGDGNLLLAVGADVTKWQYVQLN